MTRFVDRRNAPVMRFSILFYASFLGLFFAGCGTPAPPPPPSTRPPFELSIDPATVSGCDARRLSAGEVRAKPVACQGELIGGPQAGGRAGDFLLENDRIRVILQSTGPSLATIGLTGGNILDADVVRAPGEPGNDLLRESHLMIAWMAIGAEQMGVTAAGASGSATVRVIGHMIPAGVIAAALPGVGGGANFEVAVDYTLDAGSDTVDVRVQLINRAGRTLAAPVTGAISYIGGWLTPYPLRGNPAANFVPADGFVFAGERTSYALALAERGSALAIDSLMIEIFSLGPLSADSLAEYTNHFVVGPGGAQTVTTSAYAALGVPAATLSGQLDPTSAAEPPYLYAPFVEIQDSGGNWVTHLDVAADGTFSGEVPTGVVRVRSTGAGRSLGAASTLTLAAAGLSGIMLPLEPAGRIVATVTDGTGVSIPSRLIVFPELGGPRQSIAYSAGADHVAALAPGRYRLVASHGPEWTRQSIVADVLGGVPTLLSFALVPAIDTTGFIGADFHVHSENSPDGQITLPDRVRSLVAEGLEYVAATDHDYLTDYTPVVAQLGLSGAIRTAVGDELSTVNLGHYNAWPLLPDAAGPGDGAIEWFGMTPAEITSALSAATSGGIVEINHPREGLFNKVGYDRTTGRATVNPVSVGMPAGTDLSDWGPFSAVEVWNGLTGGQDEESFLDAMNLWSRGHRFTMIGNSDSHQAWHPLGVPRNYVAVTPDTVAGATDSAVAAGILAGNVTVCSGPFVTLEVDGMPMGSLVPVTGGMVDLHVRVQAAPWVVLDRLRIFVNESVVQTIPLATGDTAPVRFDRFLPLSVTTDGWVLARADGVGPLEELADGTPTGATNPTFLDANGNGVYDPPLPR